MESSQLNLPLWRNGPIPGRFYDFPGVKSNVENPRTHTQQPTVAGTSAVGIAFPGGVVLATDSILSYGSLARYRNVDRTMKINESTSIAVGGDYADFQYLQSVIQSKISRDYCQNDGQALTPRSLFSWLTRILYNRRTKMNPLWVTVLVGGMQDGKPFLGYINKLGTAYEDPVICTGMGDYLATPLLRDALKENPEMNETEAREAADKALEILFYRDARAAKTYNRIVITAAGTSVEKDNKVSDKWLFADYHRSI